MTLSRLWGKITGADKKAPLPKQQGVSLGRVGDFTIIFPYGMSADLPNDTILRVIAPGVAMPVTTTRPSDAERSEPVFFHPATNARFIARNSGDLEMVPADGRKVLISGDFEVTGSTALSATVTSNGKDISDTHGHAQANDSAGNTEANISGVL